MSGTGNPFEYEAANNLSPELIVDYYIQDFNYTRFIQSKRNVFLVGERGSGKTMTLLYNSYAVQYLKTQKEGNKAPLNFVGVYVPCNTPLTHKQEYKLLDEFRAAVISEHFLALSILYALADTLAQVLKGVAYTEHSSLRTDFEFVVGRELPRSASLFADIKIFAQKEISQAQQGINSVGPDAFYERALSFSMVIMPLLESLKRLPKFEDSHFMLMLDDAHDLNPYQVRALNSWIAYRDHSLFSFKVATSKVGRPELRTASGGSILEGHDFTTVDMEQPYQFDLSNFGRLASKVVQRRLERIGIQQNPEEYFPVNKSFQQDLEDCGQIVRARAEEKFQDGTSKQIADYVYKYRRVEYFRRRDSKANRPPYSGFETLVYLSTGVIRNLLEPCFWMFDEALSLESGKVPALIPPEVQTNIIMQQSEKKWELLRRLDQVVVGCSYEDARRLYSMIDALATLFRERLLYHNSEPRANSFTISGMTVEYERKLLPLLGIAQRAQILYVRSGAAKDEGRREDYYVPNRMLWPSRGLDPVGQHARVSIKASDLWRATEGQRIPFIKDDDLQPVLFEELDA